MQNNQANYIAGVWVTGDGEELNSVNPATGASIWRGNSAGKEQIEQAIQSARQAFMPWMSLSLEDRFDKLEIFIKSLSNKQEDLSEILAQETGKPLWEAKTEISAMISKLDISKQAYLERCKETTKDLQGVSSIVRHKPHGVVVVLGPFNFPGHLPNGHIIPALLAGNTVIYKPSELTPYISMKIMQCWQNADLPVGVINMLQGGSEIGQYLVDHKNIDGIFFTGSANVGAKIQAKTSEYPQRILALEMGGNNPLIVANPDNIAAAVYHTIQSAFITAGQRCTCARRLIVVKNPEGEKFVQRLLEACAQLKVGPYTDRPEPFLGAVISNAAAEKILAGYQWWIDQGAKVLLSMQRPNPDLAILTPGILDVSAVANTNDEEIFGPLLRLTWVDNITSAINVANDTGYGLSAGLLSADPQLYKQFYQEIRAGIINWNRPITGASSTAPFGGIGKSGNHRPSAYYAADYCSYPVASLEESDLKLPDVLSPGITL